VRADPTAWIDGRAASAAPGRLLLLAVCLLFATLVPQAAARATTGPLAVSADGVQLAATPLELIVTIGGDSSPAPVEVLVDGDLLARHDLGPGEHSIRIDDSGLLAGSHTLVVRRAGEQAERRITLLPGWLSLLPPILAIGLALAFRNVLLALFVGVFSGVLILQSWNPFVAFGRTIDSFIVPALTDADHASILVFSTLLGGMVGIVSRSRRCSAAWWASSAVAAAPRESSSG